MNASLDKDSAKRDRQQLAAVLREAGAQVTERRSLRCPFHNDHSPSAEIRQASTGNWYFYCYTCQISADVWELKARVTGQSVGEVLKSETVNTTPKTFTANGQTFRSFDELLATYRQRNPNDEIEETNPYTDPLTNEASFYTLRIRKDGKKTFRQVSKIDGEWQWKGCQGKSPLFNRQRVVECERVLIVEGEKCVREFTKLGLKGIAATTSPGGAVNAGKADWSILAGKTCYIWRDYDEPGLTYEKDVIAELKKLDCTLYRVQVEDLELAEKEDLADYLEQNAGTNQEKAAAIELVLQDAEPLEVTSALSERFRKIISGEFRAIPFPQLPNLSKMSKALVPATVTTICADPGAGKSFFVLENAWRWVLQQDESVKLLMLEDDDDFHQQRALAQMSGYASLTDDEFVYENAEFAREQERQYKKHLEKFARHLETTRSEQRTLDQIAEWVEYHANNGVRIIIVDPITAAKVSDKPWIDDQRFMFRVKAAVERTGASLILTTHPRTGQAGKPSLSGMAGGASYPRFSQCVLWLKKHEQEQQSFIVRGGSVFHWQTVEIRKARNGKGQGANIALNLNFQNLCYDELGIVDQKAK